MSLNKKFRNYFIGLSLASILGGCTEEEVENQRKEEVSKIEINSFGYVPNSYSGTKSDNSITSADMDGDGDTDIVIVNSGGIFVYENKIPQKNLTNKLDKLER